MVIKKNPKTGKYYIAPSPPSFYESKPSTPSPSTPATSGGSSSGSGSYSGPVRPGTNEEEFRRTGNSTPSYSGPVQPGTTPEQESEFRRTGRTSGGRSSRTVPSNFVGPLQPGITREEAPQSNSQLGQRLTPGQPSQDINKGYLGTNPNIPERGVLTVTKEEGARLKASGEAKPYWVVESETPRDALMEATFAGSTPQINRNIANKDFNTRSLYEYNFQNILAGKETYRQYKDTVTEFKANPQSFEGRTGVTKTESEGGITYQLTPEYFDKNINYSQIQQNALVGAKAQFKELPSSTRKRLNYIGYSQGFNSVVLGAVESGGTLLFNLGQAKSNEQGVFEKRSFKLGGTLGKIRNYPSTQSTVKFSDKPWSYLKQKGTSPDVLGKATAYIPLAIYGVKSLVGNVKSFGVVGGMAETAGSLSPFKIKPGIYSQPITRDTSFTNIKSIKGTSNGITTRVYSGSSGNIKLTGVERSVMVNGKTVGGGYTVTRTPYTQISPGGRITMGTRTTLNPYTFGSGGSGSAYGARGNQYFTQVLTPSYKGGTSTIISSKGVTAYSSPEGTKIYSNLNKAYRLTGGSASQNVRTGVKDFISGRATSQYKTTYSGDTRINFNTGSSSRDFIYSPSGKYKLTPQLSGREYDLNAILGGKGNKGYTSFRGGGGSGLKSMYKFGDGGIKAVIQTPTPITVPTSPKVIPFKPSPKIETPRPSQYAGLGMYEKTVGGRLRELDSKVDTQIKTDVMVNAIIPKVKTGVKVRTKSRGRSRTAILEPVAIAIPKVDTAVKTKVLVRVRRLRVGQNYKTPLEFTYGNGGRPASFKPYNVPVPIPIPSLPMLAGGGRSMSLGNVRPRGSSVRYTPSFKALFFKIRGQAPRGKVRTGINFRPITPGFSFTGRRRTIRVRRIRL